MKEALQPIAMAGLGVAGFEINRRFIPSDVGLNFAGRNWNDLVFGLAFLGAGYFMHNKLVLAFGFGATVEGVMVTLGL